MVDQLSVSTMINHEKNIDKRPSSAMSNEDLDDEQISCEQKMLPENRDVLKSINTVQKVDNGRNMYGYRFVKDHSVWFRCKIPILKGKCLLKLEFNPIVSMFALALIWIFILWCCIAQDDVPFNAWKLFLSRHFTWLYIGAMNIIVILIFGLLFSKYANVKLGSPDDKPEYNNFTWFMMLFACGVGVGLFFYGVGEPIYHYTGRNRYSADPSLPDNELAQIAINLPMYHWGLHGWAIFSIVGLVLSLMSYREKLPLTMKSCFYPLIGDGIFGWIGDFIDVFSIMATLFGVCTSLGIGAKQVAKGLAVLHAGIDSEDTALQVILIWCITAIATISTVSGLSMGIRRLSELSFGLGMFIMLCVFCLDRTEYILNLFVQSLGYYFQHLLQLGWQTDAFEQLGPSHGREDRNRYVPKDFKEPDGPSDWIHSWTMFYWGWWISFTPFVAMFLAKISKGRTVKEYVLGTILAPSMYCFIWLIMYGGVALRLERDSSAEGLCCKDSFGWFYAANNLTQTVSERNIENQTIRLSDATWMCEGNCGECATTIIRNKENLSQTYTEFLEEYHYFGNDFGSTNKDRSLSRLSCHSIEQMWFDVMRSYTGIGNFLSAFSLIAIILYFVTSSDSGSLVIDCLSANGIPEPPAVQRVFWALTEGATATALLVAGGKNSLTAIQTIGIVSALPYSFIILMICISLWRALKVAKGTLNPNGNRFECGLIDPLAGQPFKMMKINHVVKLFGKFLFNILFASFTMAKVGQQVYKSFHIRKYYCLYTIVYFTLFLVSIMMYVIEIWIKGAWVIGLFSYFCFCGCMAILRRDVRDKLGIVGSIIEDFVVTVIIYPSVAVQLETAISSLKKQEITEGKQNVTSNI